MISFVNYHINDNTVGSIIKTNYYDSLSLNKKNYVHKIIKDIFINKKQPNSCSKIDFNTIENKFDISYDITWNIEVFKDELNRNLISFVSIKNELNIHCLDKDNDFIQIIDNNPKKRSQRVYYYKDVLDLKNITDFLIVSYDERVFNIYMLKIGNYFVRHKNIEVSDFWMTVIPNHKLTTNYFFSFDVYDKWRETKAYHLNKEDNKCIFTINDYSQSKLNYFYAPYYEYTETTESVFIVQCTVDLVCFYYNLNHTPMYRTFQIHPKDNKEVTSFSVINKDSYKHLYCCNSNGQLLIFDFESQIILHRFHNTCKYFILLNNNFLIGYNTNTSPGDVILFDINNKKLEKRYKSILNDIYDMSVLKLAYIDNRYCIFMRDKTNLKYSIKKFCLE